MIDALPPLRDVQIVAVIENRMTLTGFEIGTGHVTEKAHYQQSWLLELVTHETLRREAELTEQWVADAERSRAFSRHVAEFVGPRKPIPSHPRHRHR
ncbi:hypothetical protein EV670_3277 [Rivibacter subsaxonicus]|uniref:Uncharacterized protein n=1 Tax=Rivibacter subsaxonicus TaxID=457575 RepID=A0A4Q7VCZ3_9BURK|nr:hypothetical protein EV670_3277 [Rivibacter subsaxonicus]